MKEGGNSFHIFEVGEGLLSSCVCGLSASWIAKGIEDCFELICHAGFLRGAKDGQLSSHHPTPN